MRAFCFFVIRTIARTKDAAQPYVLDRLSTGLPPDYLPSIPPLSGEIAATQQCVSDGPTSLKRFNTHFDMKVRFEHSIAY